MTRVADTHEHGKYTLAAIGRKFCAVCYEPVPIIDVRTLTPVPMWVDEEDEEAS